MKKYFKFLTLLALMAPVTAACSNNSTSSNSTAKSSASSKSSVKKSSKVKSSKPSDESSSSSSEDSSQESSTESSSSSSSQDAQSSSSEEKSSSATSSSQSDDTTSKMNLAQIKDGNFSSLEGNWELVKAVGAHKDVTDTTDDALNVEPTGFANESMNITAKGITADDKTYPVQYTSDGDSLTATLTDEAASKAAINWSVSFYPAGSKNFTVDGEKQDPPTKNTIVIWTSNNNFSEVFQEK